MFRAVSCCGLLVVQAALVDWHVWKCLVLSVALLTQKHFMA